MKKNLFFFYKSSHGELHAGLPFIIKILRSRSFSNSYFVCESCDVFNSLPEFYKEIIVNNFTLLFTNKNKILSLYLKYRNFKNYLFTCDSGHTAISRMLTCFWINSRIVFFSHAYAILPNKIDSVIRNKDAFFKARYTGYHHKPICVAHNKLEINYRREFGYDLENIVVAGNLGYKEIWHKELFINSEVKNINQLKVKYMKVIFIPTRDIHETYLSETNSNYLLESLSIFFKKFPNYLFLIKLHPRQKNHKDFSKIKQEFPNVVFTELNTMVVSKISDLVVSYWSSSVLDALSVNCPAVEFYRHEVFHTQLVKINKRLISLHAYYNLCPAYTNREEVIELLSNTDDWIQIQEKQQKVFRSVFLKEYPEFVTQLFDRFENTPKLSDYKVEMMLYLWRKIKNMAFSYLARLKGKLAIVK